MILLTSNTPPIIDDLFEKFLKDKNYKTLVFIETAAEVEEGDKQWLEDDHDSLVGVGFDITRYSITGKDKATLENELANFDIIYVSGGNTFYLLEQMQKSGALEVIPKLVNQGKPYIGTSAGSVIAGPDISPAKNIDDEEIVKDLKGYKGLSLVDIVVFPHWGSSYFREVYLNQRLDFTYDNPVHKIVLLTDHQYVYWNEEGYMKIFEVTA